MATGWLQLGDSWYYLNNDGKSQKGWQTIKNKRYYFDENGIMLKNAWVGNRYVKDSGAMATGWLQLGDSEGQRRNGDRLAAAGRQLVLPEQ